MGKIYKIYCEYYIRANNRKEVEKYVQEEVSEGFDFYERHILLEDTTPSCGGACIDVDIDLTKGKK